jgi:predicted CXXCH cytochrome family protein
MKKVLALVAAAGILATASFASAASIVGSKHDLSASGTATMSGNTANQSQQICIYCHAPHNANLSLPLWNRNNPDGSLFTLYSGLNMANVSFKQGFTADSTSLFCMSCHDGQTNVNAVYNSGSVAGSTANGGAISGLIHTGGTFATGPVASTANLTRDLSKTHPINFPVTGNSQSDLNWTTGTTQSTMGPGVAPTLTFTKTFPLFKTTVAGSAARTTLNTSLECGSCHSVHNSEFSPFLRDTLDDSKLCLGCHNK